MLAISYSLLFTFQLVTASVLIRIAEQPTPSVEELASITPSPSTWDRNRTREILKRGLFSKINQEVGEVISELGSKVPAYIASKVPAIFQDFPSGDKVQERLGLDDNQVSALPTEVLNFPYVTRNIHSASFTELTIFSVPTGIGPIKDGTCVSMATSTSNLTSPMKD